MKQKLLFWGPVLTASGYGEHARQLLKALIVSDKFDLSVCSVRWGSTAFLADSEPLTLQIRDLVQKYELEKGSTKYDISIQVTIPNEFQKLAAVNIGVTAGIEVDRVSPEWIKKANELVDLVIVPSNHSANTYGGVVYKDQQDVPLQLQKPMLIVSEGFDAKIFNTLIDENDGLGLELEAEFNFLTVGLGLDRAMEEDRKNISGLIKWFCQTFPNDERVGLVLKTGIVNNSLIDFNTTTNRIEQIKKAVGCGKFPRIKLIHGRLTKQELANLYRHPKIKAYVTTTHGEGFGLPIIEAAACGLPVLATNWSGHLDFLKTRDGKKKFISIDYDLKDIPKSAVWQGVMENGTKWACVREDDVKSKLKKMLLSQVKPKEWALELASELAISHNDVLTGQKFVSAIEQFISEIRPQQKQSATDARADLRRQLSVPEGVKTLLYTMPMSAGDVFISSAIIDSLKKKFPDHMIFFATEGKYADIVKDNPNVSKIIGFENWMTNVSFCESVFDEVYTPNLAVQMLTSNWVHGGKGRLLGEEFAAQCQVEFGEYFIKTEEYPGLPEKYIAFHPGSGKGQWEARNYRSWKKVIGNLKKHTDLQIMQVGLEGDPIIEGCTDLRGRTTYNQLANVIQKASCLVGIDSVTMHMAAAFKVPCVALFGSSYSTTTGPVYNDDSLHYLLDARNRCNGGKACYKHQCAVDRENPCINEILPVDVVIKTLDCATKHLPDIRKIVDNWEEFAPKIAGYTHVMNAESQGFPYIESIKSMLGFCDEVVVVDGGSTDGTLEKIKALADEKIKIFDRTWDWNEPGMDGMQKAFGRAMVSVGQGDFLWQQDADEVVHEEDYEKIKKLAERFPSDTDIIHLPVVELWGKKDNVRTDRHSWKWRMSRNNFRVTHGINKDARVFDQKTGMTYAKKGMSDGCEYVDIMTGEHLPHKGFYTKELELVRQKNPVAYGESMNKVFAELPSVFHYSWADLPRKIGNFKSFWNKCWSKLYNDPTPVDRFPDVHSDEDVIQLANKLLVQGGEHGDAKTFTLARSNPIVMNDWLEKIGNARRHLHNDEEQASSIGENTPIIQEEHQA